jgi:predicted acetyltransferase
MASEILVRTCTADDWQPFCEALGVAFGEPMSAEGTAIWRRLLDDDKMQVAMERRDDRETIVGTAAWLAFDMTVPGGELPVAAVTTVGVLPTHRRRGILRQLMRFQLDDFHARGIAVATLWASEPPIYYRFGYGLAVVKGRIEVDPRRVQLHGSQQPLGQTRLVTLEEAQELMPGVYEQVRKATPASFRRTPLWWETRVLALSPDQRSRGATMYRVVLEIDGTVEGYALYRITPCWGPHGLPNNELDVLEALGTSPAATREVWRYLFNIDLVGKVSTHRLNAQHPLFLGLTNLRQLQLTVGDGTWVRLVDVKAALEGRRYACEGNLTFELVDQSCPWNAGVRTLEAGPDGATVRRATASPELRLSDADLGAMYLGTIPCTALVAAGRAEELVPGAARRADLMFHSDVAPWCLDDF